MLYDHCWIREVADTPKEVIQNDSESSSPFAEGKELNKQCLNKKIQKLKIMVGK